MRSGPLVLRRMILGGGLLALYGLWIAVARLPWDAGARTWLGSAVWSIALFVTGGALAGLTASAIALAVGRPLPRRWRAPAAALVETLLVVLLFAWLLLNEFLFSATQEVFGLDAFLLVWHNTAAVFENAWRMAAGSLVLVAILILAALVLVYSLSWRSFRGVFVPVEEEGKTANRPASSRRRTIGVAGSLTATMAVVAAFLAAQLSSRPSEALTVLFRSAPPLRAMELTRLLADANLMGPPPARFGLPVITEAEYAAQMGSPRTPPPNVVFILLESVSARSLHCYGYPRSDITPNIDALAAGGTLFEMCLGTASFSVYGLTSAMTSLYMLRGERFDHFVDSSFPFMGFPRALKLAGYELALFSSGNESFDNIRRFYPKEDFDTYFSHDTCDIPKTDCMRMDDRHAVGEFERWLARRTDPRPFYCGFYLQSTHFNYEVPEPWASHYLPVPPLFSNGDGILQIPADVLPKLRNQYDNAMRYLDHWVGRIRAALEKAGVFDNTLVVILADHGEAFMEHGLARHGVHVWNEMIHVPLIFHAGRQLRSSLGYPLPSRVPDMVSGLDVAPTIAAVVGIRPHPSWQGVNVLAEGYTSRDRPIFSLTQYTRWQEVACLNGIKYIYDLTDDREHLFDLWADPDERTDLAAVQPELTAAMRQLLSGWHTHQLTYYKRSRRPFTHYIGRYEPDAPTLDRIRAATERLRNGVAGEPLADR